SVARRGRNERRNGSAGRPPEKRLSLLAADASKDMSRKESPMTRPASILVPLAAAVALALPCVANSAQGGVGTVGGSPAASSSMGSTSSGTTTGGTVSGGTMGGGTTGSTIAGGVGSLGTTTGNPSAGVPPAAGSSPGSAIGNPLFGSSGAIDNSTAGAG